MVLTELTELFLVIDQLNAQILAPDDKDLQSVMIPDAV